MSRNKFLKGWKLKISIVIKVVKKKYLLNNFMYNNANIIS